MCYNRFMLILNGFLFAAAPLSSSAQAALLINPLKTDSGLNSQFSVTSACLTANSAGQVVLEPCGQVMTQQWRIDSGAITGQNGLCLDTQGGALSAGTPVIVQACTGSLSQNWSFVNGSFVNLAGICLSFQRNFSQQAVLANCGTANQGFVIF